MRRVGVLMLPVLALALLTACGDDDDKEKSSGSAQTKAQYVEQANAVCKRTSEDLNKLFEGGFPVVRSQIPEFVTKASPLVTRGMADLRAVSVPEEEKAKVEPIRTKAEEVSSRWTTAAADQAEGAKLFDDEGGFEGLKAEAKTYGLADCEKLGDDPEDEAEPPVDAAGFSAEKKAYIEKVDAVCKAADVEDNKIEEDVFGDGFPPTMEQWAAGLPRFAALSKQRSADIKKVAPPAADKAQIDALFAKEAQIVVELDKAAQLAEAGNEAALIPALNTLFPQFDEHDVQLRAYGFQVCGASDEE